MASEFKVDIIKDSAGLGPVDLFMQSASKVYASFEQQGVHALKESLNVSSIVDNGVGLSQFTLTNTMASSQFYAAAATEINGTTSLLACGIRNIAPPTATTVGVHAMIQSTAAADLTYGSVDVKGDLA